MRKPVKPAPAGVSDDELRPVFEGGPALFSNKFYFVAMGSGIRLTFMEEFADRVPPQFRGAFYLDAGTANALRDVLVRMLKPVSPVESGTEAGPAPVSH